MAQSSSSSLRDSNEYAIQSTDGRETGPDPEHDGDDNHGKRTHKHKHLTKQQLQQYYQEISIAGARLRIVQAREHALDQAELSAVPPYSYRGVPYNRSIDEYTDQELQTYYAAGQLSVVPMDGVSNQQLEQELSALGFTIVGHRGNIVTVSFQDNSTNGLRKAWKTIDAMTDIQFVAPRQISSAMSAVPPSPSPTPVPSPYQFVVPSPSSGAVLDSRETSYTVNDPGYLGDAPVSTVKTDVTYAWPQGQWALNAINAEGAWKYDDIRGSQTTLADLDTGLDAAHPDLRANAVPGIDSTPTFADIGFFGTDTNDYVGHGTEVAGVAAATCDNGVGLAGVGWGSHVMPIAVFEPRDPAPGQEFIAYQDNMAVGGSWAVDSGARVLNFSDGSTAPYTDTFFYNMVRHAWEKDVPVIAASGNEAKTSVDYPAAIQYPNVIAVGAVGENGPPPNLFDNLGKTIFSNSGPELKLVAPGQYIKTTDLSSSYSIVSGTSFAAPMVSAAFASLRWACRALPFWQIRDVLYATATPVAGQTAWCPATGYGMLNFGAAADFLLDSGILYSWTGKTDPAYHGFTRDPNIMPGSDSYPVQDTYVGLAFGVRPYPGPNLVSLASFSKRTYTNGIASYLGGDFIVTSDRAEMKRLMSQGYFYLENLGYISTISTSDAPYAVYRLFDGTHHMFTSNQSVAESLIAEGYKQEAIIGYSWYQD